MSDKPKTIFDHLSGLTDKKVPWEELSDADRKSFTPYMINRWLSMNVNYIELINSVQQYVIGQLTPEQTYKLYFDILPKTKSYNKYIKSQKEEKYNPDLVKLLSQHFLISRSECLDILDIYVKNDLNSLIKVIKLYGKTDKEIKDLLKTK